MKKNIIVSLVFSCLFIINAFADSPLTSTPFWEAYQQEKIISTVQQSNGILTPELADFLISKKNKIDIKMAVINCISWNINGKENSSLFLNRLIEKNIYSNTEDFKLNGRADHMLCMAYLLAMDNYFDVKEALDWAERAKAKNPKSYTFAIIHGLILGQVQFDNDWCLVYKATDSVRKNQNLNSDMKAEAIEIIFNYMDLYGGDC